MIIDDYGRTILGVDEMIDHLYAGEDLDGIFSIGANEVNRYNDLCTFNDKLEYLIKIALPKKQTASQAHAENQQRWFVPDSYLSMNIWDVLRTRCKNEMELVRLGEEELQYEERGLIPLLQLMMYLVDEFRHRKVVWGVGRGSSVASFALYLIGIIKINPMVYGLEIGDFLKD